MADPPGSGGVDALALLRTRRYLVLLVLAAVLGVPIATLAYWFLYFANDAQRWLYDPAYLPKWLGFHGVPVWWPLPLLFLAGLLVGWTIRYLPGRGGHSPADGFHAGGAPPTAALPGIALAALTGLALGAVVGPEGPLIALGGGVAAGVVRAVDRQAPEQTVTLVGANGSFAAISTLLGSPLTGAFLLMEASGIGGPMLGLLLVPGLVASGVGAMVFVGFDAWTGHGTVSLAIVNLPHFPHPDGAEFAWAIVIGVVATVLGGAIRWMGLTLKPHVERHITTAAPLVGLAVGGLAVIFVEWTGKPSSSVLFSGQSALPSLVTNSTKWSVGALVAILVCKGLAYGASLSGFRGGPTFPAMFLGAVGGIALSHLPGLPEIAGVAMGMGAMTCVMLGLPLTAVLITTLFMGSDGITVMPIVIVAVVVAYVGHAHVLPRLPPGTSTGSSARPTSPPAADGASAGRDGEVSKGPAGTVTGPARGPDGPQPSRPVRRWHFPDGWLWRIPVHPGGAGWQGAGPPSRRLREVPGPRRGRSSGWTGRAAPARPPSPLLPTIRQPAGSAADAPPLSWTVSPLRPGFGGPVRAVGPYRA